MGVKSKPTRYVPVLLAAASTNGWTSDDVEALSYGATASACKVTVSEGRTPDDFFYGDIKIHAVNKLRQAEEETALAIKIAEFETKLKTSTLGTNAVVTRDGTGFRIEGV